MEKHPAPTQIAAMARKGRNSVTTKDLAAILGPVASIIARAAGYSATHWRKDKSINQRITPARARSLEAAIVLLRESLNAALKKLRKIR